MPYDNTMKNRIILITGATGHLGNNLVQYYLPAVERGEVSLRVLVLPGEENYIPAGVEIYTGDVRQKDSLAAFFDVPAEADTALVHAAGIVSIASGQQPLVHEVNVIGTDNVMKMALAHRIKRVVHVASVHAIMEPVMPQVITEPEIYSPEMVKGAYAKSKAAGINRVLAAAAAGLDVRIVLPSGIIGPGDRRHQNHMVRTLEAYAEGKISFLVPGGYDFVDARDVADGIDRALNRGKAAESYILSGSYISIKDLAALIDRLKGRRNFYLPLPYGLAEMAAPAGERLAHMLGDKAPLLTPYAVSVLHSNGRFSHEKASRKLGYAPRDLESSIRDTLMEKA